MAEDHWPHGFNFNVEEWSEGDRYETLAICRTLAMARAAFKDHRREAERALHDPQPHPCREAASRATGKPAPRDEKSRLGGHQAGTAFVYARDVTAGALNRYGTNR
jgi:hypothetical protein